MNRHGPGCLDGPISLTRAWWAELPPTASEGPGDETRAERIARVRREIHAGTYDTEEKWSAALERLLRRLGQA